MNGSMLLFALQPMQCHDIQMFYFLAYTLSFSLQLLWKHLLELVAMDLSMSVEEGCKAASNRALPCSLSLKPDTHFPLQSLETDPKDILGLLFAIFLCPIRDLTNTLRANKTRTIPDAGRPWGALTFLQGPGLNVTSLLGQQPGIPSWNLS